MYFILFYQFIFEPKFTALVPLSLPMLPPLLDHAGEPILYNQEMKQLDFEVELAIVIGKGGKYIPKDKAANHIIGYTVAHDVSERYFQFEKNGKQWTLGKTFDTFCPLAAEITTTDEITDIHKLGLRCFVNGVQMQNGNTSTVSDNCVGLLVYRRRFLNN
jgi:2-keto-4-pentenoate hydratase/2-oxohepta-3-ene-1,7-dioic acid hydratase in catechol pathway